jgi:hypothetical protein
MPNWKQIVRKHLHVLTVCSPEFTEEVATHLEDNYEALLREGLPAEVAFQHTIRQIEDRRRVWLVMRFLQEELMSVVIREIALPGLLTSAAAGFLYWAFALDHVRPNVSWLVGGQFLMSPLWWWCLLPIWGALGALLSRRNGGSRLQRVAASLLPSAIMGAFILLIFVVGFTLSGLVNQYWWVSGRLESLGLLPPEFVLIPAAFSVLGAGIAEVSTKKFGRPA